MDGVLKRFAIDKMGQNLVIICHKCKIITFFNCRFSNLNKKEVQEYFFNHKGHKIMVCGDDGGWDLRIANLVDERYKRERMGVQKR